MDNDGAKNPTCYNNMCDVRSQFFPRRLQTRSRRASSERGDGRYLPTLGCMGVAAYPYLPTKIVPKCGSLPHSVFIRKTCQNSSGRILYT